MHDRQAHIPRRRVARIRAALTALPFWAVCALGFVAGVHALFPVLAYLVWYARLFGIELTPRVP